MGNNAYKYTTEELCTLVDSHPWWSGARMELLRRNLASLTNDGKSTLKSCDRESMLIAELYPIAMIAPRAIDVVQLTHLTHDDLIDRFLKRDDYRIVAEEGTADDLSQVVIEDDEDFASEELAEIYLNQGLYDEAIKTYRKLSLLNSEKSVYFAGLIAEIEDKKKK